MFYCQKSVLPIICVGDTKVTVLDFANDAVNHRVIKGLVIALKATYEMWKPLEAFFSWIRIKKLVFGDLFEEIFTYQCNEVQNNNGSQ